MGTNNAIQKWAHETAGISLAMALLVLAGWMGCPVATRAAETIRVGNGDFEEGIAGWKKYQAEDPTLLSQSAEQAHSGAHSLKVETSGKAGMEGANSSVKVTPGERYLISVYVKGEGKVTLCCIGAGGWVRGAPTVLTPEWQELTLTRFEAGTALDVHVIRTESAKGTFYVDTVSVVQEEKELPPAEVAPVWFEAEDYPWAASLIAADPSSSKGAHNEGKSGYPLAHRVPFPQTANPVYVYLKMWIDAHDGTNGVQIWDENNAQIILEKAVPSPEKWTWVKAGPLSAKAVGHVFTVAAVWKTPDPAPKSRLDALVLTTQGNVTDEELKELEKLSVGPRTALSMAGATAAPPRIDGVLDDACWTNAVELAPFTLLNQNNSAREQTRVYVCYDKENLYAAFRCEASCLDPLRNQLGAFKKDVTTTDDNHLFQDDCIGILLATERDKDAFFDIFINGAGTVNDAKCGGNDPWGTRDKTWNSKATIAARTANGYWAVECSIPFTSLGASPKLKDSWRACFGRLEQNQKEISSWPPVEVGVHELKYFGRIVFGEDVPGIKSVNMGDLTRGKNLLTAEITALRPKTPLRIETSLAFGKGLETRAFHDYTVSGQEQVKHEYLLNADGDVYFQYSILNPATLATYYGSPRYSASVKSSILKAEVIAQSPYKLYVNGTEAQKETALFAGENTIAIETEGPIRGEFSVGDFIFRLDSTWKYSSSEEKDWNKKSFDDSGWKPAAVENGLLKEEGYLRKIVLLNHSAFWPNWEKGGVSIAQNSIQQLLLVPEGIQGRTLTDYNFFLEVPEYFNVVGASSYYKGASYAKTFVLEQQGTITRDNQTYKKYLVRTSDPMPFRDIRRSHLFCAILVQLPVLGAAHQSDKSAFYYYLKGENGQIEEVPRKLPVNILPPLKGKQPGRYMMQMWTGWLSNLSDDRCRDEVYRSLARAGFNDVLYGNAPEDAKMRNSALINITLGNGIDCTPYLQQHPELARVDYSGKVTPRAVCPTALLEDAALWGFVEGKIAETIKSEKLGGVQWDCEHGVWDSEQACFCPRCFKQFRQSAGISAATELTPEIIKKDFRGAWIKYMTTRMALVAGKERDAVKKVNPDAIFSVYSGYQSEATREEYSVDWGLLADKIDLAMCGYQRPEKEVADTLKALGKTPLVASHIVYPYYNMGTPTLPQDYPAFASKATVLRRAVDGTGGVMVYELTELDGRTFYSFAEISRLIADHEGLFISHHKDNSLVSVSGGFKPDDVTVFTDGKTRLILLINEDSAKKTPRLVNEQFTAKMKVYDYYAEKELGNLKEIAVEVAPNDVKAFLVTE